MVEAFQHEYIRKLAAIGPALLEEIMSVTNEHSYYARRYLASVPSRAARSSPGNRGGRGSFGRGGRQSGGRNTPRVVLQSGDLEDPDDIDICHGQVKRIGVLSSALTSMSLCKSSPAAHVFRLRGH